MALLDLFGLGNHQFGRADVSGLLGRIMDTPEDPGTAESDGNQSSACPRDGGVNGTQGMDCQRPNVDLKKEEPVS